MSTGAAEPDRMRSKKLRSNWKLNRLKTHSFLVPDLGGQIEGVVGAIAETVGQRASDRCTLVLAGEETQRPGERRALRAMYSLQPGHIAAADVLLKSHQGDLYVEMKHVANTRLALLRVAMAFVVTAILCGAGLLAYTKLAPGAMNSWVLEFASRHAAKYAQAGYLSATGDVDRFAATELLKGSMALDVESMESLFTQSLNKQQYANVARVTNNTAFGLQSKFWEMQFSEIVRQNFFEGVAKSKAQYGDYLLFTYPKYGALQNGFAQQLTALIRMNPATYDAMLAGVSQTFAGACGEDVGRIARLAMKQSTVRVEPKSLLWMFLEDPRLGIAHMGVPVGLMMGLIGFVFVMLPPWALRYPARWFGMPTPDEFESTAHAHMAWLERVVGDAFQTIGVDTGSVRSLDWK